jgi:hypothetical protein
MFGVHLVMPKTVVELFFGRKKWFGKHGSYLVWNIAPLCLIWTLWRERNKSTFNRVEISTVKLKYSFVISFFEWSW